MELPIKSKAITRIGSTNGHIVSLPSTWIKAKLSPDRIVMVVGNLLIIAAEDEKELAVKAATQLMEAGLMEDLGIKGFEEVAAR